MTRCWDIEQLRGRVAVVCVDENIGSCKKTKARLEELEDERCALVPIILPGYNITNFTRFQSLSRRGCPSLWRVWPWSGSSAQLSSAQHSMPWRSTEPDTAHEHNTRRTNTTQEHNIGNTPTNKRRLEWMAAAGGGRSRCRS